MNKNISKSDPLIAILTRSYALNNSGDDEFVREWGFKENSEVEWFNNFQCMVLHGQKNKTPEKYIEIIDEVIKKEGFSLDKISEFILFEHGMVERDKDNLEGRLKDLFSNATVTVHSYGSRGEHAAVIGLIDILENELPELIPFIMDILNSTELFLHNLLTFQQGLFSLTLNYMVIHKHIAYMATHKHLSKEDQRQNLVKLTTLVELTEKTYELLNNIFKFKPFVKKIEELKDDIQEDVLRVGWWWLEGESSKICKPNSGPQEEPYSEFKNPQLYAQIIQSEMGTNNKNNEEKESIFNRGLQAEMNLQAQSLRRIINFIK